MGVRFSMNHLWKKLTDRIRRWRAGCNLGALLIGGGATMLAGVLVRAVCGSPYRHGVMVQFDAYIPPVWLMTLLWMLWYFVLGATFVGTLWTARCNQATRADVYWGGMLFLSMLFFGFVWYPLFFVAARFFLAWLVVLVVLALCLLTALRYWKVSRLASGILLVHAVFLFYLWIVNFIVIIHS